MAATLFFDLSTIDFSKPVAGVAEIEAINPQRGDMRHLDGIVWINSEKSGVIGYKDTHDKEFWVPGHIPGRPLLPGVLMIEAAAQLAAYVMKQRLPGNYFLGFVGCENVRFRGQVAPGKRLILLGKEVEFRPRRLICDVQGVVDNSLVFEARIIGMPI